MADKRVIESLREKVSHNEAPPTGGPFSEDETDSPDGTGLLGEDEPGKPGDSGPFGEDEADKAVKKIIALTNVSERSERALRERLAKCEFSPEAIEEAVSRAKRWCIIDDAHFAQTLIRSRISQGKGSVFIARDLRSHGIDPNTIPGWPDECRLSESEELERAIALLEKKPPRCKNLRDGAYRRLAQKGFPSSVASNASRIWYESQAEQA